MTGVQNPGKSGRQETRTKKMTLNKKVGCVLGTEELEILPSPPTKNLTQVEAKQKKERREREIRVVIIN